MNIEIEATTEKPYSIDSNILHTSYEGGILENSETPPKEEMYLMSVSPEEVPDLPEYIDISFKKGDPISINGNEMTPAEIFSKLNMLGGKHGIGRADIVENRFTGIKSRGIYETPGGTILRKAHILLESIVLDRELLQVRILWCLGIHNLSIMVYGSHLSVKCFKQ